MTSPRFAPGCNTILSTRSRSRRMSVGANVGFIEGGLELPDLVPIDFGEIGVEAGDTPRFCRGLQACSQPIALGLEFKEPVLRRCREDALLDGIKNQPDATLGISELDLDDGVV